MAIDAETGTTTEDLWEPETRPGSFRSTRGLDEWLTLIASGQAIGISSEATRAQHPRPGVAYRLVEDAPAISVWLAWWQDDPPPALESLIAHSRRAYGAHAPTPG